MSIWKTSRCSNKTKPISLNNVPAGQHGKAGPYCRGCSCAGDAAGVCRLATPATAAFTRFTNAPGASRILIIVQPASGSPRTRLTRPSVRRVLEILQPDQIEIAFRAVQELERRSQAVDQQWRMRLERLEYQAQLAQRRYEEVDPSNRLVAATLEQRWNQALQEKATAQEELNRQRQQQGLELTEGQKGQLLALAKDLPQLWKSPSTSGQDRKRMLRLLIKDITVERPVAERKALLHLRWQGGAVEDLSADIPLPAPDKVRYPQGIVDRVRALASSLIDPQIAAALNQERVLSARGKSFTASMIKWIRYRHAIPAPSLKQPEELTVGEVARRFSVGREVVYYWIERGHLPARKLSPGSPHWITLAPETEARLRAWVANSNRIKPAPSQTPAASGAL